MLAFIDESGYPHPRDSSTRPICVSVCINERESHSISARLHALKRNILGKEDIEFKAKKLLNRATFRRIPEKRELVEAYFDLLRNLPITIFAIIMERPQRIPVIAGGYLPNQLRYLLQRCDLLAQESNDMVTILFDGECQPYAGLSLRFNSFLYRSTEGSSMRTITDAPFFVNSKITAGIQIADMAAGTIRIWEENQLRLGIPQMDPFLSAIDRYHNILEEKTKNLTTSEGYPRPGFYLMPERDHYSFRPAEEPDREIKETPEKPENQA